MMSHLCFSVDDIEQMRAYLRSKGFDVPAGTGTKTRAGDYAFEIKDPNGMLIEFVQSLPSGMEMQAQASFFRRRASRRASITRDTSSGTPRRRWSSTACSALPRPGAAGRTPNELSWINMKVPDGDDYVELMLYHPPFDPKSFGTKNHLSLVVPDIEKAVAELQSRAAYKEYAKPLKIQVGRNGKRQVNLYDPDGTRVELMEPNTVTGQPAPPSTAPPPPSAY